MSHLTLPTARTVQTAVGSIVGQIDEYERRLKAGIGHLGLATASELIRCFVADAYLHRGTFLGLIIHHNGACASRQAEDHTPEGIGKLVGARSELEGSINISLVHTCGHHNTTRSLTIIVETYEQNILEYDIVEKGLGDGELVHLDSIARSIA